METLQYIHLSGRRLAAIVLVSILCALVGVALATQRPAQYEAKAVIFASQALQDDRSAFELDPVVDDLIIVADLDEVLARAEAATNLTEGDDFTVAADRVDEGSMSVEITATSSDAENASAAAEAVGRATLQFLVEQESGRADLLGTQARTQLTETNEAKAAIVTQAAGLNPVTAYERTSELILDARLTRAGGGLSPEALLQIENEITQLEADLELYSALADEWSILDQEATQAQELLRLSVDRKTRAESSRAAIDDGDLVVTTQVAEQSIVPLLMLIQLGAFAAVFVAGVALFTLADLREEKRRVTPPRKVGAKAAAPASRATRSAGASRSAQRTSTKEKEPAEAKDGKISSDEAEPEERASSSRGDEQTADARGSKSVKASNAEKTSADGTEEKRRSTRAAKKRSRSVRRLPKS